jgi:hypothetical protein
MQKFRVEADREAEAVVKFFDGEAVPVENNLELADLCDDRGLPAEQYPALAEELGEAGILSDQTVIPSVISIEKVENDATTSGANP